jgi:2,4-dienoyl-CoA reductase-like NADH-dependent reductase (Old Yellow Enzyme family)
MQNDSSLLFSSFKIRDLELKNRIMISPMCTYQAKPNGLALDIHFAHYAQYALGGAGLIMVEATAVEQRGRISAWDLGLWSDEQIKPIQRLVEFAHQQNSKIGVQLAHAGLKGSTKTPWNGNGFLDQTDSNNGVEPWQTVGPSPDLLPPEWPEPRVLSIQEIKDIVIAWGRAAARANKAGFDVIEIHAAHGYLISEFLSPLSNLRTDKYGGDFESRTRLAREIVTEVRLHWPDNKPLFFRLSVIDGIGVGWSIDDSVQLATELKTIGVDLIDCSSGGLKAPIESSIPRSKGFQVYLADAVKFGAQIPVAAVGLITDAEQAENILKSSQADLIAVGRSALNNPYWPRHAAHQFHADEQFEQWPEQYGWWLHRWSKSLKRIKDAWPY